MSWKDSDRARTPKVHILGGQHFVMGNPKDLTFAELDSINRRLGVKDLVERFNRRYAGGQADISVNIHEEIERVPTNFMTGVLDKKVAKARPALSSSTSVNFTAEGKKDTPHVSLRVGSEINGSSGYLAAIINLDTDIIGKPTVFRRNGYLLMEQETDERPTKRKYRQIRRQMNRDLHKHAEEIGLKKIRKPITAKRIVGIVVGSGVAGGLITEGIIQAIEHFTTHPPQLPFFH